MGRHSGLDSATRKLFEERLAEALESPVAGSRVASRRAERMATLASASPVPTAHTPVVDTPSEAGMLSVLPESSTYVGVQTTGAHAAPSPKRNRVAYLAAAAAVAGMAAVGAAPGLSSPAKGKAPASADLAALGAASGPTAESVAAGLQTITVSADGTEQTIETSAATIGDALSEAGIVVGEKDRVSVALGSPVLDGTRVEIVRVEVRPVTEEETIAHETIREDDPTLEKGTEKVATEGVDGLVRRTFDITYEGGNEVSRELVLETTVTEKVDEVVKVGTKEKAPEPVAAPAQPAAAPAAADNAQASDTQATQTQQTQTAQTQTAETRTAQTQTVATTTPSGTPQQIAHAKVLARGWGEDQFSCLVTLWTRESSWNPYATNPSSGAYGIPQSLPASKMASAGADWRTNPATQIEWGLGYISGRYGTPCNALSHSYSVGWY